MTRELEVLAELARRSARVEPGPQGDAELRRLGLALRRRQRRTVGVFSVGMGMVAAAAAVLLYVGRDQAPLTYAVEGDVSFAHRAVDVRGAGARMSFSDGTRFELARATRAELTAVDERGAQLRLHKGSAHVAVIHKPRARWAVQAGPFTVRVIGTVFDVAWSAEEQTLEVSLLKGQVAVEGPLPQLPLAVRAGQQLVVRARDGQLRIAPIAKVAINAPRADRPEITAPAPISPLLVSPRPPTVGARRARAVAIPAPPPTRPRGGGGWEGGDGVPRSPMEQPAPTAPAPAPLAIAPPEPLLEPSPVAPIPAPPPTWTARILAGNYRAILDEALAEGLANAYGRRSSDDLTGLSDAARYLGRRDVSREALLAQRRRFAGAENARRAAFRLGVLAEEASEAALAIRYYDLYLAEAPAGTYAPEALGRKMLAVERRDGTAGARALAEEYRRQFPQGAYLVHALRILQGR